MTKGPGHLQPHLLVTAEDEHLRRAIMHAVIQGNLFYVVDSIFEAVALCLKACFDFNLDYPLPTRSTWSFLQTAGFEISTTNHLKANRLMELLTRVKYDY
jgi:hypothetical protein